MQLWPHRWGLHLPNWSVRMVVKPRCVPPAGRRMSARVLPRVCRESCCCAPRDGQALGADDQIGQSLYLKLLAIASCGEGTSDPVGQQRVPFHLGVTAEVDDGEVHPLARISERHQVPPNAFAEAVEKVPIPPVVA